MLKSTISACSPADVPHVAEFLRLTTEGSLLALINYRNDTNSDGWNSTAQMSMFQSALTQSVDKSVVVFVREVDLEELEIALGNVSSPIVVVAQDEMGNVRY